MTDLDLLRQIGDPLADDAVAAYVADVVEHDPRALFVNLVRHVHLSDEDHGPAHLTGRLQTDTQRRLNETAQLLMDIATPVRWTRAGQLSIAFITYGSCMLPCEADRARRCGSAGRAPRTASPEREPSCSPATRISQTGSGRH